jgi:hypothetical protein
MADGLRPPAALAIHPADVVPALDGGFARARGRPGVLEPNHPEETMSARLKPTDPATPAQQRELRRLAQLTGTSFTPPRNVRHASQQIDAMRKRRRSDPLERTLERQQAKPGLQIGSRDATRISQTEIHGFGSTATWR